MANDKYNIEIELKTKAEEALKAIDALNDIENATENLTNKISNSEKVIEGALYHLGGHITNLALKIPSLATQTIKAFVRKKWQFKSFRLWQFKIPRNVNI